MLAVRHLAGSSQTSCVSSACLLHLFEVKMLMHQALRPGGLVLFRDHGLYDFKQLQ